MKNPHWPTGENLPTHKDLPCSDEEMLEDLCRRLEHTQQLAERERQRAAKLAEKLRQLGVDPDQV